MEADARIEWPDGRVGLLSGRGGWTVDGRSVTVAELVAEAPALRGYVLEQTERVLLRALSGSDGAALLRELFEAQRALRVPDEPAAPQRDSGMLRLSVTADGAALDEPELGERVAAIFLGG